MVLISDSPIVGLDFVFQVDSGMGNSCCHSFSMEDPVSSMEFLALPFFCNKRRFYWMCSEWMICRSLFSQVTQDQQPSSPSCSSDILVHHTCCSIAWQTLWLQQILSCGLEVPLPPLTVLTDAYAILIFGDRHQASKSR
jgi:hypothetical protein